MAVPRRVPCLLFHEEVLMKAFIGYYIAIREPIEYAVLYRRLINV